MQKIWVDMGERDMGEKDGFKRIFARIFKRILKVIGLEPY